LSIRKRYGVECCWTPEGTVVQDWNVMYNMATLDRNKAVKEYFVAG
jgi:hypothetical protein